MGPVTHQTIKLSRGRHGSPADGACVMELASMLAGEPFSDHPASVCPVIGSFLRGYNDSIDDHRRQDLYAYAAKVVGSRGSQELERVRVERLREWAPEREQRRWTRFLLPGASRALAPEATIDAAATRAVRAVCRHEDRTHPEALALLDELLALRAQRGLPSVSAPMPCSPSPTPLTR